MTTEKQKRETDGLLPCPFCGGEGYFWGWIGENTTHVACKNGCCTIPEAGGFETKEEARRSWNKRKQVAPFGFKMASVKTALPTEGKLKLIFKYEYGFGTGYYIGNKNGIECWSVNGVSGGGIERTLQRNPTHWCHLPESP